MKKNKVLEERWQRVLILLKELQYKIVDFEGTNDSYSIDAQDLSEFMISCFIDLENKFVEFSLTFSFMPDFQGYLRKKMDNALQICYKFGIYINIMNSREEIVFTLFSKVYYSGLNYHTLKYTLLDLKEASSQLAQLFNIKYETDSEAE